MVSATPRPSWRMTRIREVVPGIHLELMPFCPLTPVEGVAPSNCPTFMPGKASKSLKGRSPGLEGSFLHVCFYLTRGLCYQGADVLLHQIPRCQPFVWTAELKKADLELGKGEGTRGFWPCQSHLAENPGLYAEIS